MNELRYSYESSDRKSNANVKQYNTYVQQNNELIPGLRIIWRDRIGYYYKHVGCIVRLRSRYPRPTNVIVNLARSTYTNQNTDIYKPD